LVVLTAAHCAYGKNPTSLKIRAGEWDTQTIHEIYAHEDRDVEIIKMHEQFVPANVLNDVALLFLAGDALVFMPVINTICLPPQDYNFDNQRCFASGWGQKEFAKVGEYSVILKKVELPMIPQGPCKTSLQTTRLGRHFILHESFVCAGGEKGNDMCGGDGGGPLVCPIVSGSNDRYYQSGIVSWVSGVFI
jgi:plasma kallikrein